MKAAHYDENTLNDVFDKFFSTFVAFNRLYSHFHLQTPGHRQGDKWQATQGILEAVGADRLLQAFTTNNGEDDLREMQRLMQPGGRFYLISIATLEGPDEAKNRELHSRLTSQNPRTRVKAILEYLYYLRCNMFHGSKNYDRDQIEIVRPAARCLRRVVVAGLERLAEGQAV